MKNYSIDYNSESQTYSLFSTSDHAPDEVINFTLLAENVAPEIISAAIYRLLEELKEKKIEGYDKAFGEET